MIVPSCSERAFKDASAWSLLSRISSLEPLMMPLAFTLLSIGFANVIRTQWVLPQGRDTIFVHSVLTGAVINLIANFVLIPPFGAMGAAAATVLAEFSVPAVQFVYLRKELPYAQYLKTTGTFSRCTAGGNSHFR